MTGSGSRFAAGGRDRNPWFAVVIRDGPQCRRQLTVPCAVTMQSVSAAPAVVVIVATWAGA